MTVRVKGPDNGLPKPKESHLRLHLVDGSEELIPKGEWDIWFTAEGGIVMVRRLSPIDGRVMQIYPIQSVVSMEPFTT